MCACVSEAECAYIRHHFVHKMNRQGQQQLHVFPDASEPLPHHVADAALPPGPSYYKLLFERFLGRVSAEQRADISAWIVHAKRGELDVATICSGTDVPLLVYGGFAEAARAVLGVEVRIVPKFSCEKVKPKQTFLRHAFGDLTVLFKDAKQLGSQQIEIQVKHDNLGFVRARRPQVEENRDVGQGSGRKRGLVGLVGAAELSTTSGGAPPTLHKSAPQPSSSQPTPHSGPPRPLLHILHYIAHPKTIQ